MFLDIYTAFYDTGWVLSSLIYIAVDTAPSFVECSNGASIYEYCPNLINDKANPSFLLLRQ